MEVAALIVSVLALIIAIGSVVYTRRTAIADEKAVDAAGSALALEQERAASERREREKQIAPRPEIVEDYTSCTFVLTTHHAGATFAGKLENHGGGTAHVETATLIVPGSTIDATFEEAHPRIVVGSGITLQFLIPPDLIDLLTTTERLTVEVTYAAADTPYRARRCWQLLRTGSDHTDRAVWRLGESQTYRL